MTTKGKTIREYFTDKEWKQIRKQDPSIDLMGNVMWQDPDNFVTLAATVTELVDLFPELEGITVKPSDKNWREIQKACWNKYRLFGPLNASVNSKADYVAEAGFSVYSDEPEINMFLMDLWNHQRNKLYARMPGVIIRMLAEGEMFILLALDEEGTVTVRILEPDRIGTGEDMGLLTDPDDAYQTLFYKYRGGKLTELIPDVRFILEPEYMIERTKALGDKFDKSKVAPETTGKGGKFKKVGGYRRFILHWKNLTGIYEYLRDTSSLATVVEWINLYVKSMRWGLDHKRSLSAYTWALEFEDTPAGKVAWHLWNKMTAAEREATGLTKPLTPGSRVFTMPGLKLKVYSPQLPSLSGEGQDVLNLSGAGARTPQDLWQGQSAGSSYASIRTTRPPLVAEIENLQGKLEHFLRYDFLRPCFAAKLAFGGKILGAGKKTYKLPETYKMLWPVFDEKSGQALTDNPDEPPKVKKFEVELCEAVIITFPSVKMEERPQEQVNAYLGSKHGGMQSIGVSNDRLAREFGIFDLSRERRKQAIEKMQYGSPPPKPDQMPGDNPQNNPAKPAEKKPASTDQTK